MPNEIFNTPAQAAELAAAREQIKSGKYNHIYDWILECGSRRQPSHCPQCVVREEILRRDNLERSLDHQAEQLRKRGYQVIKPTGPTYRSDFRFPDV